MINSQQKVREKVYIISDDHNTTVSRSLTSFNYKYFPPRLIFPSCAFVPKGCSILPFSMTNHNIVWRWKVSWNFWTNNRPCMIIPKVAYYRYFNLVLIYSILYHHQWHLLSTSVVYVSPLISVSTRGKKDWFILCNTPGHSKSISYAHVVYRTSPPSRAGIEIKLEAWNACIHYTQV